MRVFIALRIPPEWHQPIERLQRDLRELLPSSVRWSRAGQIHLTLRFLGDILAGELEQVTSAGVRCCAEIPAFSLRCEGLGCFPSASRPRVLWAGLAGAPSALEALRRLRDQLTRATATLGEPPEPREFTPHLTLARLKELNPGGRAVLARALERPFAIDGVWPVGEAVLMRSELSPQGAHYETLVRWPLEGSS